LNATFEKIGYATDSYLGHLTVCPSNLGSGLSLSASVRLDDPSQKELIDTDVA